MLGWSELHRRIRSSPCTANPLTLDRPALRAGIFGLAGAMLLSSAALADDAPASPAARGSWQTHKYSFQFLGFTSTYSCDGLADRLKELLLAAGARADAKSRPGACAAPFGRPDKFARADLTFSTLAPLGAGALRTASRSTGTWRAVIFSAHSPRDLQIGDCELVEQFRQQVLPMFTTRNLVSNTTCIPIRNRARSSTSNSTPLPRCRRRVRLARPRHGRKSRHQSATAPDRSRRRNTMITAKSSRPDRILFTLQRRKAAGGTHAAHRLGLRQRDRPTDRRAARTRAITCRHMATSSLSRKTLREHPADIRVAQGAAPGTAECL